jgi:hypothetical protein
MNVQTTPVGVLVVNYSDEVGTLTDNFQGAQAANLGTTDVTVTQNGNSFTIPAGSVFNWPDRKDYAPWAGVVVDASGGGLVQFVYYI